MSITVMKQALEALKCIESPLYVREINKVGEAITALRQAIEQAEKQPPQYNISIPGITIDPNTGNVGIGTPVKQEQAEQVGPTQSPYYMLNPKADQRPIEQAEKAEPVAWLYQYKPAGEAIGRIEVFEPKPNIVFQTGDTTEVMRLTKDGVWVNPDIKPDEAAQAVLSAIDAQIKTMVQRAIEEEREACAKVCDEQQELVGGEMCCVAMNCAAAIRARSNT